MIRLFMAHSERQGPPALKLAGAVATNWNGSSRTSRMQAVMITLDLGNPQPISIDYQY